MASSALARGLLLAALPVLAHAEDARVTLAEALAIADQANPELQAAALRGQTHRRRGPSRCARMRRPRLDLSMG